MVRAITILLSIAIGCAATCTAQDRGLAGLWHFDGDLKDASGHNGHGKAAKPRFTRGRSGQALVCPDYAVTVPNAPNLQLFPGLTIDCWVRFDRKPTSYVNIVSKDKEYLLRVNGEREGGDFSFFVYLDGWEPRVRVGSPEPGKWQHLVARWTGWELSLEVDGVRTAVRRFRPTSPTSAPVVIGGVPGRIDEVRIVNPRFLDRQWLLTQTGSVPDAERTEQASFGGSNGWSGWNAARGASAKADGPRSLCTFPNGAAMWVHPGLDIETHNKPYLLMDIQSPTAKSASLSFVTDQGYGETPVNVCGPDRTAIVKLAFHPVWRGKLKLLALSFPEGGPHEASVERIAVSERPAGKPFLYTRNMSPGRAILRAGRDEEIVAVIRSLGGTATNVRATLHTPKSVRVLNKQSEHAVGDMGHNTTQVLRWAVRADRPLEGEMRLVLAADGFSPRRKSIDVRFTPALNLPKASYVPRPQPAKTQYHIWMHYCPLWKFGTHYGWNKIELWPERKPAIGFYDEGTPEVADWHIKYALEHGVEAFIYCWYRRNFNPKIEESLGHAIHDGMLHAKYLDMFKFCIMWENGCAKGVKDRDDLMDNVFPYWMKHFFTQPSYLKVDNKPVLFVWRPERVSPYFGGVEQTRKVFDEMRAECRKQGFDGLWIIGCVGTANRDLLQRMAKEGWDASSAYATWPDRSKTVEADLEGDTSVSHEYFMRGQKQVWLDKRQIGALPDLVNVMMGWDNRPWFGHRATFYTRDVSVDNFDAALREAKGIIDSTPGNGLDRHALVLDNWTEFGEGHYLEPCAGLGFGLMDAVRRAFCEHEPHTDITPEDVGLELPDRVYRQYRQIMFREGDATTRRIVDDLVAWWAFDRDDEHIAFDSSACRFSGFKHQFEPAQGVKGKAFRCKRSCVSLDAHEWFFPLNGVTVELWMKTDVPNQSDHWMVNTVGSGDDGYRLGLSQGKVMWQVPMTQWSHGLVCREPVALGQWTHVAATYDNKTLRVFINGAEQASRERGGPIRPAERNVCIGSYSQSASRAAFEGVLDEVRIYCRPLTPEEIRQRFEQTRPKR